ncbi:CPBP family intramembrane metalloprotease [Dyadobacter chenwenxiniae]|uniref:CPBP family intramembrane metalloprotease n=1 Tax=Dyadobacter chenwenxiniae TaxID=2906456 RepID=A0A9X1PR51_9BACT|nr:CPBP family intramembrane glutamic endopeptidase [Dyadobacter chenwenxiniae]MCF0064589.1 CPBP family intramembrane metalloprotease [Dyadobacter chenwenxiniae]UON84353.1 CPBP family intramembrane metalloprotease [Dyadobacter chenwenxiniae]
MRTNIIAFLLFTFIWSWLNWGIALYYLKTDSVEDGMTYFISFFFIGAYGPTLAAIITTAFFEGSSALRALLKRLFIWRASPKVYLAVFALPIIFMFSGIYLYHLFVGSIGNVSLSKVALIPSIIGYSLFAGPMGEELGWRGYLLPKLLESHSSTKSSIVIGFIWVTWHIPLFFGPTGALISYGDITFLNVSVYLLATICLSYLFTYLSSIANGSVLIAILTHLSVNAGLPIFFFPNLTVPEKALIVFKLTIIPLVLFTAYVGTKNTIRRSAEK